MDHAEQSTGNATSLQSASPTLSAGGEGSEQACVFVRLQVLRSVGVRLVDRACLGRGTNRQDFEACRLINLVSERTAGVMCQIIIKS